MSKAKEIFMEAVTAFKQQLRSGENPFALRTAPMNGNTKRPYGGFNRWHLASIAKKRGYETCAWLTMKQINALGGRVKKGEKSTPVFMWGFTFVFRGDISASGHDVNEALGKVQKKDPTLRKGDLIRKVPFLKMFLVFEVSQTEGLDLDFSGVMPTPYEQLLSAFDGKFERNAFDFYDVENDVIKTSGEDPALVFGSMIGWTGHQSRLDRRYELPKERLVQAFGASFLAQATGEKTPEVQAEYIEQWLEALNANPYFLWKAAGDAEKAAALLLENVQKAAA